MQRLHAGFGFERLTPANLDCCLVRRGIAQAVVEACRLWPPGGSLLDVGCGAQPYRRWVEEWGLVYHGIDWSHSQHEPEVGDVLRWDLGRGPWPLPDVAFDALLCTEVLEHVPDPGHLLAECARVARPGALLLLTTPLTWPEHEAPHDYLRFTRFGLARLCEQAGFAVERLEPRGGWATALAQLLGFWASHGFPAPGNRLIRLLAWPLVAALACWDFRGPACAPYPFTLGYAVFARRRA